MNARRIFDGMAADLGLFEVNTSRARTIMVLETGIDMRNAVVSERPGEGSFVELENSFVMTATATVADALVRHMQTASHAMVLLSFEDDCIRLVSVSEDGRSYMDGDETILDDFLAAAA